MTTALPRPAATAANFRAVGNPAPPRLVSPARPISAMISSRRRVSRPTLGSWPCRARWLARVACAAMPCWQQPGQAPGDQARFVSYRPWGAFGRVHVAPATGRGRPMSRASTAVATATAEPISISATHQMPRSLPAVSECRKAAGQAR